MPNGTTDQGRGRDRALVARLVAGDDGAWEEFLVGHQPRVSACVRRVGVRDDDNGDACSFVFEALHADGCRRLRAWDGRASLATYLHAVAANLARDFLRSQPRVTFAGEEEIDDAEAGAGAALAAETRVLQARLREAILRCLFRMEIGADREILLFHYHAGLTAEEIARLSGRSRNAVDQALHRARRHLRAAAEAFHPELAEYLGEHHHGA